LRGGGGRHVPRHESERGKIGVENGEEVGRPREKLGIVLGDIVLTAGHNGNLPFGNGNVLHAKENLPYDVENVFVVKRKVLYGKRKLLFGVENIPFNVGSVLSDAE